MKQIHSARRRKKRKMDPLECAKRGDVSYFKSAALDDFRNSKDEEGNSVFSIAAKANHLDCCKEIYHRCPSLIYQQSSDYRYTALHHAAWRGDPKMIEFLIAAAASDMKLLRLLDDHGQSALYKTVVQEKYEAAKLLLEADHAFDHGETTFMKAMEISYGKADNSSSAQIRRLFLQNQPNLNYVHKALQNAMQEEKISTALDIIKVCPGCIKLVDSEEQNIVHLAANLGQVEVLKAILKSNISAEILNARDKYGYTPLHRAALGETKNTAFCTEALFCHPEVDKETTNKMGKRVEEAVHEQEKRHGIRLGVNENELKNQRDFDLVVCALIATISFTSGIMVPGGYISDGPDSGMATLSKRMSFKIFIISNTFALLFSLYAVFSHYRTRHLLRKKDIEFYVKVATFCTLGAIFAMVVAFIAGSYLVLTVSKGLAITVCAMGGTFFFLWCYYGPWGRCLR